MSRCRLCAKNSKPSATHLPRACPRSISSKTGYLPRSKNSKERVLTATEAVRECPDAPLCAKRPIRSGSKADHFDVCSRRIPKQGSAFLSLGHDHKRGLNFVSVDGHRGAHRGRTHPNTLHPAVKDRRNDPDHRARAHLSRGGGHMFKKHGLNDQPPLRSDRRGEEKPRRLP